MEVKPGYKRTEVGVIPEEWKCEALAGRIAITHGFAFQSQYFDSHGPYRLTTPGHFHEQGGFRDIGEKQKYYTGPVPNDYVLQPGDLILAMTEQADGLLGSAAIVPEGGHYLHNQRLGRVKSISATIDIGFLYYVFNSSAYRSQVRETAAGTKVKHTSPAKLLEIETLLPPLPEQHAIAGALSDMDALIRSLDQLIAKKHDLKQAAMQQLLTGQTRLPGFHGEWGVKPGYKQTEVGVIPEEWDVLPFKEQFNISAGGDVDPKHSSSEKDEIHRYPIYSNALTDQGFYGYCSYADHPANSITITARGTLGVATYRDHKYTAIGRVLVLEPKRQTAGHFFAEFI